MRFFRKLPGIYRISVTSAAGDLITKIAERGISLSNITFVDELCFEAEIVAADLELLTNLIEKHGGNVRILKRIGMFWKVKSYFRRPVLIFATILLATLSLYLPTRVLFVQVDGNQNIPSARIVESAEISGIKFGASRREVRSERVKNAMLGVMPELQWVGINTKGCVAVISVEEGDPEIQTDSDNNVSSIVAARDGIIQEITVSQGTPLCKTGQAVSKGQVLVSGYTDCGIKIRADRAEAEVSANTFHKISAITPQNYVKRVRLIRRETRYLMCIAKKIINLRKDSGILDAGCVKMYERIPLQLPGGFTLPVSVIKVTYQYYETEAVSLDLSSSEWLSAKIETYLRSQMISGQILQRDFSFRQLEDMYEINGEFACLEMIGVHRREELIAPYEQGYGTDR